MPDPRTMKVGDKIRILSVPEADLWAFNGGATYLADTIKSLRWMVGKEFVVDFIDEGGAPWVSFESYSEEDCVESMAITDTDSWEFVE